MSERWHELRIQCASGDDAEALLRHPALQRGIDALLDSRASLTQVWALEWHPLGLERGAPTLSVWLGSRRAMPRTAETFARRLGRKLGREVAERPAERRPPPDAVDMRPGSRGRRPGRDEAAGLRSSGGGPPSSIIRRTYAIARWIRWDDELNGFVRDFRVRFGVAPNVLLANDVTFNRIDLVARKSHIRDERGESPGELEWSPLSSFVGDGYELMFALDVKLPDTAVSLIYDSDPDGGGEEVPAEDTRVEVARQTGVAAG